ncbi:1,4-dihydroxy-2-naphthoate octaprenyltransferase, partial [Salmonella enterica subsp. enterica]
WYLQAHTLIPALILPATACGLLATAVLNINNLRDINSDRENGKNTLVVRLGDVNARRYHACLLLGALLCLALVSPGAYADSGADSPGHRLRFTGDGGAEY